MYDFTVLRRFFRVRNAINATFILQGNVIETLIYTHNVSTENFEENRDRNVIFELLSFAVRVTRGRCLENILQRSFSYAHSPLPTVAPASTRDRCNVVVDRSSFDAPALVGTR